MKVKTLLAKAAKCKTQADVDKLLDILRDAFSAPKHLAHLLECNPEAYMEDDKPFIHFELNKVISNHYITMIRPEIRDGVLVVIVVTNHMLDGLGIQSNKHEPVEDLDDMLETTDDQTIAELAKRAKDLGISHHSELIQRVGVPREHALPVAYKSW